MTQALPSLLEMQYNIIERFQQDYVFFTRSQNNPIGHKLSDTFHILLARRLGVAKQSNQIFRSFFCIYHEVFSFFDLFNV